MPTLPAEGDPIAATVEELPAQYACAKLNARGRKLRRLPRRTLDAYTKCRAALDAKTPQDVGACLRLTELLASAPRDEVLRDNVATRACARGNKRACRMLADSRLGQGVRFDPLCAEQLLDTLCSEGELGSCFQLGALKLEGVLVAEDKAAGRSLIERACDQGEFMACLDLVRRGGLSDTEKKRIVKHAFDDVTKACASEDPGACLELASAYDRAGQWFYLESPAADSTKLLQLRQRACGLGSLDACGWLDHDERTDVYKDDCDEEFEACAPSGQAKDESRKEDWAFRRCAAGWDGVCGTLARPNRRKPAPTAAQAKARGAWLETGCLEGAAGACAILTLGTVVPLEPSDQVLKTGCDLGLAASCLALARASEGRGDAVSKRKYLERACPVVTPQGRASTSRSACRVAGVMYKDGVGTPQDLNQAAILLQKACVERRYVLDGEACEILGTMFEGGLGVQKSLARAVDLYAAGCADERYLAQTRARAASKGRRFSEPEWPPPTLADGSTACKRLEPWVKPKDASGRKP